MSICLQGAAGQGLTAEQMAAAKAAECREGKEKQGYLKIVEILKDHLESRVRWTGSNSVAGRFVCGALGLTTEVGGQSTVGHCAATECLLCHADPGVRMRCIRLS